MVVEEELGVLASVLDVDHRIENDHVAAISEEMSQKGRLADLSGPGDYDNGEDVEQPG